MTVEPVSLRGRLRALPSIVGNPPGMIDIPAHPAPLMIDFLTAAINAGIPEPHAITLVTITPNGGPDARVLIIKDIDQEGAISIATSAHSAKGVQLSTNRKVALSWYCTAHARAIRVRGTAVLADHEIIRADFAARSSRAKAIASAGTQSSDIKPSTDRAALIDAKEAAMRATSGEHGGTDWQVWRIMPDEVEFWQGAKDRNHERLLYRRHGDDWSHSALWP